MTAEALSKLDKALVDARQSSKPQRTEYRIDPDDRSPLSPYDRAINAWNIKLAERRTQILQGEQMTNVELGAYFGWTGYEDTPRDTQYLKIVDGLHTHLHAIGLGQAYEQTGTLTPNVKHQPADTQKLLSRFTEGWNSVPFEEP